MYPEPLCDLGTLAGATHDTNFPSGHPQPPVPHGLELPINKQGQRLDTRKMQAAVSAQPCLGFAHTPKPAQHQPTLPSRPCGHLLSMALSSQVLSVPQDSLGPHPFFLLELYPDIRTDV